MYILSVKLQCYYSFPEVLLEVNTVTVQFGCWFSLKFVLDMVSAPVDDRLG